MKKIDAWEEESQSAVKVLEQHISKFDGDHLQIIKDGLGYNGRILTLISLIRKKDELLNYVLGPTRDLKHPYLEKCLALTDELE